MKRVSIAILSLLISARALAQDPEFPKDNFVMVLNFHSGIVTSFDNAPELYAGGLQLIPQYTLITNLLRGGGVADVFYTDKNLQAAIGPILSIKLMTLYAKPYGSLGNINISIDHLWGTGSERLLGGGINADLHLVVIGLSLQRDYNLDKWWLQTNFALRISKVKKTKPIGQ